MESLGADYFSHDTYSIACWDALLPSFAPCTRVLTTSRGHDTLAARIPEAKDIF